MDDKKVKITKMIALLGTIVIWLPIFFTLLTAAIGSIAARTFLLDYLMPAELFPFALAGSLLLLWATIRAGLWKKEQVWSLAVMVVSLAACQGSAVLTGLASGDREPSGWPLFLVMSFLGLYIAAILAQGILGIFLLRKLQRQ